jgi:hypothetical protein
VIRADIEAGTLHDPPAEQRARMATSEWEIPPELQPSPADHAFDLDGALRSVVAVKAMVPPDAFTAQALGTERAAAAW